MNFEFDPIQFGKFYQSFEKAIVLGNLIGSGWQREIRHSSHKLYTNGFESYDWIIVYLTSLTRIDLSITELYIGAGFINHLRKDKVTMVEHLERIEKSAKFWRVPIHYVVAFKIEGKNKSKIEKEMNKLLQKATSEKPSDVR